MAGAGRGGVALPSAHAPAAVAGDAAGRAAARAGTGDHGHAGGAADLHGAPDRGAGGEESHRAAGQRVQESVGQGEHPFQARRGVDRRAGGDGPPGRVPGGVRGRGDAAGAGARVQDPRPGLPAHGADHVEGVLHQPLPARTDQAAGRAGVPLVQPHAPAGDRGPGAGGPVRERGEHHVLPAGRDGAGAQGDGRGLGRGRPPHRQAGPTPGGAHGLRGCRLPGPARPAQVQGDLGCRRRQVAQPRRGPAPGLRRAARGELPRAAQAAGRRRLHRRAARADDIRADAAERPDAQAVLAGHRRAEIRGYPAHPGRGPARAAQPASDQERGTAPVGRRAAHRHAQGSGAAHRLPRCGHLRLRGRQPLGGGPGRAPAAGDLRLRHEHRDQAGTWRRSPWPSTPS